MGMSSFASAVASSALVVKEIKVNEIGPQYVHVVARKAGLIAFLRAAIGIDVTTKFDVYADRVVFNHGSLSGYVKETMPLSSLSVITGGFVKPFMHFVAGIVLIIWALVSAGAVSSADEGSGDMVIPFVMGIVGIYLIVRYFLSKTMLIQVASSSGWIGSICLKCSVVEGVAITDKTAEKIIDVVTKLTMEQTAHVG